MSLELISADKKVEIIHDGRVAGELFYSIRTGKVLLEPDNVLREADNVIKVVFKDAELKDEFIVNDGFIKIKRQWKILKPGRWQLMFGYCPGPDLRQWLVPSVMYGKNEMGAGRFPIPVQDKFLCAILAGIIMGVGTGIILRSAGSSGGTDILSVMVLTKFAIRMGNTVIAFNTAILIITALLFSLESALYTLIFIYVTAHFLDLIVTGLSQRKSVMIISRSQEEIVRTIMKNLNRGVTVIKGRGGYTGELSEIIYTVITFRELSRLKRLITRIDPDAFVVVSDTTEVIGHRIGNQPHW